MAAAQSSEDLPRVASELRRLHRDLMALSALPAAWTGRSPQRIAESLAEVLLGLLPLDLVYVAVSDGSGGEAAIEAVHGGPGMDVPGYREAIGRTLRPWLESGGSTPPPALPGPSGEATLRCAAVRFGHGGGGCLAAGSRRPEFPTDRDRLLLGLGANQAAIVIQHNRVAAALQASEERHRLAALALQESDRRKDEFLAILAHELRNPLAPIQSAIQYLMESGPAQPDLQWARDVIARQVRGLARLVDDLLDVSRIAQGKIELRRDQVEVAAVVARAVEISREVVDRHRHELSVSLPAEPVWLTCDPLRLEQVLVNLLTNAAKYTPENGRIELSVERREGEVVFRVRDNGIGIDAEMLAHVFEPFVQLHRSAARAEGGLGVGLALVRSLVELHGGRVAATSAGHGLGSEFVVLLPAASKAAPASARSAAAAGSAALIPARRILVVDDNVDAADSLALLLQFGGHEVQVAYDGRAALEAADVFRPDVVVLDVGLPEMDGLAVARRLRSEPGRAGMVLIALSGYGQEEDRRRALEAGFDVHFTKPLEIEALRSLLADPQAARRID